MKTRKLFSFLAAVLTACLLMAVPLSASALPQPNYVTFTQHDLYIYIPEGSSSGQAVINYDTNISSGLLSWSSSNSSVVRVNNDGIITGLKTGTAIITASFVNAKDTCTVTVYKEKTSTLNASSAELRIKYNNEHPTTKLYLSEVADRDGIRQWSSGDPAIATVDSTGLVTAQSRGKTTIYATTYRGNTLTCSLTVYNDIGRINLNKTELLLTEIGAQAQLTAAAELADPSSVSITWSTSDPAIATVSETGVVTATGDGEVSITATGSNGRYSSCKVLAGAPARRQKELDDFGDAVYDVLFGWLD